MRNQCGCNRIVFPILCCLIVYHLLMKSLKMMDYVRSSVLLLGVSRGYVQRAELSDVAPPVRHLAFAVHGIAGKLNFLWISHSVNR